MSSKLIYLLLASSCFGQVASIEKRGAADWPTRNHLRRAVTADAPRSVPVLMTEELPADFNPDSVRVIGRGSAEIIRCKVEWKVPQAEVSFISRGAGTYYIYFDVRGAGETERVTSPAMVGTGDAITYGRAGAKAKLSVGLIRRISKSDAAVMRALNTDALFWKIHRHGLQTSMFIMLGPWAYATRLLTGWEQAKRPSPKLINEP